jgi:hypothetical protein
MKQLPIGIQDFKVLREGNYIYVDKTEHIHRLATTGKYYFLSRPRRFGKSLLLTTIRDLYAGRKSLFEDLWIENRWDWAAASPVLHFSFDKINYAQEGLANALVYDLNRKAERFGITLTAPDYKSLFVELLEKVAAENGPIVLLIDEYDKPILDYLSEEDLNTAKANRHILREFYGIIKGSDADLRFVLLTGVSKFAKVSVFSHLNNLNDLTLHREYATLTGYTQTELEHYFTDYLAAAKTALEISEPDLLKTVKDWYNGYSWDGEHKVYNPFGILNFFSNKAFSNFWFSTGSPRFLIEQMKKQGVYQVEDIEVSNTAFERFDIENLTLVPLLFQSGYLTVKSSNRMTGEYLLGYPNLEVQESMYEHLIDELAHNPSRLNTGRTIQDMQHAFVKNDLDEVRDILEAILSDLPYEVFDRKSEGLYHGLVHLIFNYLGIYAQSEVHSSKGRADAIVETSTHVYIFEFKFDQSAEAALEQILAKAYADRYRGSKKNITGIGVNFKPDHRAALDWKEAHL